MNREGIHAAVSDYLDLIEKGTGSESGNEERLVPVLDGLALAMNSVDSEFDEREWPLAPRRDTRRLRALVCRRFPNYGFYNVPSVVTERIAESEVIVADAIDDIEEIAGELLDFEWYLANTSEEDAYWHLAFNYRGHWREHLRGLQFYLVALDFEAIHLPEPTDEDSSPSWYVYLAGPRYRILWSTGTAIVVLAAVAILVGFTHFRWSESSRPLETLLPGNGLGSVLISWTLLVWSWSVMIRMWLRLGRGSLRMLQGGALAGLCCFWLWHWSRPHPDQDLAAQTLDWAYTLWSIVVLGMLGWSVWMCWKKRGSSEAQDGLARPRHE